jgi:signal transduction histidine kinase
MFKREERWQRLALTILVTVCVFLVMLATSLVSYGIVLLWVSDENFPIRVVDVAKPQYALLSMLVVSMVLGVVFSAIMSNMMVKYVNRLVNRMNRLAKGDFKTRLSYGNPIGRHPTMQSVTESFNRMAEELEHTELLRSDFINDFSHEFKTPIVSIAGFARLLKNDGISAEQRKEYLDIIEEESLRLSRMATNVLDMTRIENQTILTDVTTYNLSEQLRSCVLLFEKEWSGKGISLSLDFDEYYISANGELLKHVWINLIDNAIKYSGEGGTIGVLVCEDSGFCRVDISNQGKEIPKDKQERIFDKFYQGDESHSEPGNGVGLSIVKYVVQLHNGEVSVESENGMTTFSVRLPLWRN